MYNLMYMFIRIFPYKVAKSVPFLSNGIARICVQIKTDWMEPSSLVIFYTRFVSVMLGLGKEI